MSDPAFDAIRHLAARSTAATMVAGYLADLCRPLGLDPEQVSRSIAWSDAIARGELTIGTHGQIKRRQVRRLFRRWLATREET